MYINIFIYCNCSINNLSREVMVNNYYFNIVNFNLHECQYILFS